MAALWVDGGRSIEVLESPFSGQGNGSGGERSSSIIRLQVLSIFQKVNHSRGEKMASSNAPLKSAPARTAPAKAAYDLSSLNVLVVVDSFHMLRIVRTLLNAMNIRNVRTTDNPEDALGALHAQAPELLIVDWNMIPFDGLEFVRRIRRDKALSCAAVPILLLTAHTEMERVLEARDSGVNRVMAKPVSFRTLYDNMIAAITDPRPFISTDVYTGPDRRFRTTSTPAERRQDGTKNHNPARSVR